MRKEKKGAQRMISTHEGFVDPQKLHKDILGAIRGNFGELAIISNNGENTRFTALNLEPVYKLIDEMSIHVSNRMNDGTKVEKVSEAGN